MSKRKIKMVVLMLALALILSACGNTSIFNGSKTGDKARGHVDGMVWAKLLSIDEDNYLDGTQNKYVEVEAEFCPESALYGGGDSITGFYVVLVKGENGEWLVDSFPTG